MADNPADRPALHAALQAALLRRDKLASEVVFYLLLRNYIEAGLFDAAHLLVQSTTLADPPASPNIAARRSFYIARLRATQLLFDMAAESLRLALHRSPDRAVGFRAAVLAYSVVVSLLRGEGLGLGWVTPARELLLAGAALWTLRLGWGASGRYTVQTVRRLGATLCIAAGAAFVVWGWALLFWLW